MSGGALLALPKGRACVCHAASCPLPLRRSLVRIPFLQGHHDATFALGECKVAFLPSCDGTAPDLDHTPPHKGCIIHNGQGVPTDLPRALAVFKPGAEAGHSGCQYIVGIMFQVRRPLQALIGVYI